MFDPNGVCALARIQMHEKLAGFNLDYPDPEQSAAAEATSEKSHATEPESEAMIALVPDPIHTHLAPLLDRYFDVVQQALQDSPSEHTAGWIYVSQWLPWDPMPYQASQDPVDRTNARVFDSNRECAPGFLLFRRNRFQGHPIPEKFLIVFLVGESPTSGILRPDQFSRAVRGWGATEQRDHGPARATLRILGP